MYILCFYVNISPNINQTNKYLQNINSSNPYPIIVVPENILHTNCCWISLHLYKFQYWFILSLQLLKGSPLPWNFKNNTNIFSNQTIYKLISSASESKFFFCVCDLSRQILLRISGYLAPKSLLSLVQQFIYPSRTSINPIILIPVPP